MDHSKKHLIEDFITVEINGQPVTMSINEAVFVRNALTKEILRTQNIALSIIHNYPEQEAIRIGDRTALARIRAAESTQALADELAGEKISENA